MLSREIVCLCFRYGGVASSCDARSTQSAAQDAVQLCRSEEKKMVISQEYDFFIKSFSQFTQSKIQMIQFVQ